MKSKNFVSIIIPLHIASERFFTDLNKFSLLHYKKYEIVIVTDKVIENARFRNKHIKILYTNRKSSGPAEKRDIALKIARGELCAFIDDDAYPDSSWLTNAVMWFKNPSIVAVGGPGVTPSEDPRSAQIGGHIISSYLCSGGVQHRYYVNSSTKPMFTDDWPAYNLIIRKSSLKKVGGFASTFYGGEDTYVCMKLKKLGLLVFDPTTIVYHHRRSFPIQHLNQIANVGLHRGYFFKKYPETSRRLIYLMPTGLTLLLIIILFLTFLYPTTVLLPTILTLFVVSIVSSISIYRHNASVSDSIIGGLGILVTHVVYGIYFIKGICTEKLSR